MRPGQKIYFQKKIDKTAVIKPDAKIRAIDGFEGSIHQVGTYYTGGSPCNGWKHWYVLSGSNYLLLDEFREKYRLGIQNDQKTTNT